MNILQKPRLKHLIILILLVGVLIGGYYLYGYYKEQFVNPQVVLVWFKPNVTEEEALKMLEKYIPGISTRTLWAYDDQSFDFLKDFKDGGRMIQFTVKGTRRWESVEKQIRRESIVRH